MPENYKNAVCQIRHDYIGRKHTEAHIFRSSELC